MNRHTDLSTSDARRSHRLGLPLWTLAILALLGVPRVVLHDLGVIHEGTAPNLLLVVAPPLVWIAVVLAARVRRPFLTLLVTGALYGVLLGLVHQLRWGTAFPGRSGRWRSWPCWACRGWSCTIWASSTRGRRRTCCWS